MDILAKIDEYRELLDKKDALAEETRENNKAIEKCRFELGNMMVDAETPKLTRNGYSYSITPKTKYSKAAGMEDQLMACLRENGLGDIIKETVNPQTLQGVMSGLADENDGVLPSEYEGLVNEWSYIDISRRKSAK